MTADATLDRYALDLTPSLGMTDRLYSQGVALLQSTVVQWLVSVSSKKVEDRNEERMESSARMANRLRELGLDPDRLWWGKMTFNVNKMEYLLNEIEKQKPKQIIEVGGGTSTAVLAAAAKYYGFQILTLENHDATLGYVRYLLEDLDCSDVLEIQKCGFTSYHTPGLGNYRWYKADLDRLRAKADFLLVDGPMSSLVGRVGALPQCLPYMENTARFYFDDCKRKHEIECVERWKSLYPGLNATVPPGIGIFSLTLPGAANTGT
ncbi:MAG: hypothetical protein AAF541_21245 [Pseudomonadota bacterium]